MGTNSQREGIGRECAPINSNSLSKFRVHTRNIGTNVTRYRVCSHGNCAHCAFRAASELQPFEQAQPH
jgi:hypothetical protein